MTVLPRYVRLEGRGMPDEAVQGGQDGLEARPVPSLGLPALQHQRVEGRGAARGGGETKLVGDGLHHLGLENR